MYNDDYWEKRYCLRYTSVHATAEQPPTRVQRRLLREEILPKVQFCSFLSDRWTASHSSTTTTIGRRDTASGTLLFISEGPLKSHPLEYNDDYWEKRYCLRYTSVHFWATAEQPPTRVQQRLLGEEILPQVFLCSFLRDGWTASHLSTTTTIGRRDTASSTLLFMRPLNSLPLEYNDDYWEKRYCLRYTSVHFWGTVEQPPTRVQRRLLGEEILPQVLLCSFLIDRCTAYHSSTTTTIGRRDTASGTLLFISERPLNSLPLEYNDGYWEKGYCLWYSDTDTLSPIICISSWLGVHFISFWNIFNWVHTYYFFVNKW